MALSARLDVHATKVPKRHEIDFPSSYWATTAPIALVGGRTNSHAPGAAEIPSRTDVSTSPRDDETVDIIVARPRAPAPRAIKRSLCGPGRCSKLAGGAGVITPAPESAASCNMHSDMVLIPDKHAIQGINHADTAQKTTRPDEKRGPNAHKRVDPCRPPRPTCWGSIGARPERAQARHRGPRRAPAHSTRRA